MWTWVGLRNDVFDGAILRAKRPAQDMPDMSDCRYTQSDTAGAGSQHWYGVDADCSVLCGVPIRAT